MVLEEVWDYMTPDVKRAFRTLAAEHDRVDSRRLLGGLAQISGEVEGVDVIRDIRGEDGLDLPGPSRMLEETEPCPEGLELSPAVHETLNFFRVHHLRPITPARLVLRLLQIGSGHTVRTLETNRRLQVYLRRLERLVTGS